MKLYDVVAFERYLGIRFYNEEGEFDELEIEYNRKGEWEIKTFYDYESKKELAKKLFEMWLESMQIIGVIKEFESDI